MAGRCQIVGDPNSLQQMFDCRSHCGVVLDGSCGISDNTVAIGRRDGAAGPQPVQGQECGATGTGALQVFDGALGVTPRTDNDVL